MRMNREQIPAELDLVLETAIGQCTSELIASCKSQLWLVILQFQVENLSVLLLRIFFPIRIGVPTIN